MTNTYVIIKTTEEEISEEAFIALLIEKASPLLVSEKTGDFKQGDIVRLSNNGLAMISRIGRTTTTCLGLAPDQRVSQFNIGGDNKTCDLTIVSLVKAA
jgi:hypothetical protein